MAVSESIAGALRALDETLIEVDSLTQTLRLVSGDREVPMIDLFERQWRRVSDAQQELDVLMTQQGLPRLRDQDHLRATK